MANEYDPPSDGNFFKIRLGVSGSLSDRFNPLVGNLWDGAHSFQVNKDNRYESYTGTGIFTNSDQIVQADNSVSIYDRTYSGSLYFPTGEETGVSFEGFQQTSSVSQAANVSVDDSINFALSRNTRFGGDILFHQKSGPFSGAAGPGFTVNNYEMSSLDRIDKVYLDENAIASDTYTETMSLDSSVDLNFALQGQLDIGRHLSVFGGLRYNWHSFKDAEGHETEEMRNSVQETGTYDMVQSRSVTNVRTLDWNWNMGVKANLNIGGFSIEPFAEIKSLPVAKEWDSTLDVQAYDGATMSMPAFHTQDAHFNIQPGKGALANTTLNVGVKIGLN